MPHCTRERGLAVAPRPTLLRGAVAAALALIVPRAAAAAPPRVVVTVKPLHSLVAGVMAGVGEPDLIVRGAGSPHTYSVKPSEARLLEAAQVIFWVGGSLEAFMEKPLAALGSRARIVEVLRLPGLKALFGRAGGPWESPAGHGDTDPAADGDRHARAAGHGGASLDGHVWLDPDNARVIARAAAAELGLADPANRERYASNAVALIARIDALDAEIKATVAPVRDVPYVVFHDAYQYFEARYGLRAAGSVAVGPERSPGARRVGEIRERIRALGVKCVFSEPQFPPGLTRTIVEGAGARLGTLDPLGAGLRAGPDAYFELLRNLAVSLRSCLGA